MKTFPMFLRMEGRRVVFVGGGEEVARKVRLLMRTEAQLVVAAERLDAELAGLAAQGSVAHHPGAVDAALFAGAALAFVATGDARDDARIAAMARAAGVPVNVVDRPDLCDAFTPSIVDRDPLVVAIGTEGTAPVLGRGLRAAIEQMVEPGLGQLAALAGRLRPAVEAGIAKPARRGFWEWVFDARPRALFAQGDIAAAETAIRDAIAAGGAPAAGRGAISLVGAGPGARDLLTLRAVQRLQTADVVYYDRLVDPGVLELARRDCDRVLVGKHLGANEWPQHRINVEIVQAALAGKRVVRLKSGDPGIFGRAQEEIAAADAAGIPVEIVPGLTAAVAAGAALRAPLTERGQADRLVLATATCRPGDRDPDWAAMLAPGTTLVLYMAIHRLAAVRANLLAGGIAAETAIDVVASVSTPHEQRLRTTLGALAADVAASGITNPAVVLIRLAKA